MEYDTDYADFNDRDLKLFIHYALEYAYILKGLPVPYDIKNTIRVEEAIISADS